MPTAKDGQYMTAKKSSGKSLLNLFTLKEPSNAALAEYEKQLRADKYGAPLANVPKTKLPTHVPKVNSKWDGLPENMHKRQTSTALSRKSSVSHTRSESFTSSSRSRASSVSTEARRSARQRRPGHDRTDSTSTQMTEAVLPSSQFASPVSVPDSFDFARSDDTPPTPLDISFDHLRLDMHIILEGVARLEAVQESPVIPKSAGYKIFPSTTTATSTTQRSRANSATRSRAASQSTVDQRSAPVMLQPAVELAEELSAAAIAASFPRPPSGKSLITPQSQYQHKQQQHHLYQQQSTARSKADAAVTPWEHMTYEQVQKPGQLPRRKKSVRIAP